MPPDGAGRAGIVVVALLISWQMTDACVRPESRTLPPAATQPRPVPRDLTVLLAGDSVPMHLEEALATVVHDRWGWRLVSAAVRACSIYGDPLAWADGTPHGDVHKCPGEVRGLQGSLVDRADPEIVIWWDRLSTLPFLTEDETLVPAGSPRFWGLRALAFEETFARLTAGGARVVFLATEPIGIGVLKLCGDWQKRGCREWRRFRMMHYADITQPMNMIMERYAAVHPDAVFISITDSICRRDVSPCDDRMGNGKLARADGTHYRKRGELLAAEAIARAMRSALYG
jgi:hypothetical protein